jgi:hypothetical protein
MQFVLYQVRNNVAVKAWKPWQHEGCMKSLLLTWKSFINQDFYMYEEVSFTKTERMFLCHGIGALIYEYQGLDSRQLQPNNISIHQFLLRDVCNAILAVPEQKQV